MQQLSGLLEKFKGVFSASFLTSSVIPLFFFFLLNGILLGQYNETVHNWVSSYVRSDLLPKTISATIIAVVFFAVAVVYSTFDLTLREILEGKYLPSYLTTWLTYSESKRLGVLDEKIAKFRKERRNLMKFSVTWKKALLAARNKGSEGNVHDPSKIEAAYGAVIELYDASLNRWLNLTDLSRKLQETVNSYAAALEAYGVDVARPGGMSEEAIMLDDGHVKLVYVIDAAAQLIENNYIAACNDREFNFSRYHLAPTKMGNIAESVRSYALSRYRFNIDFFWTRLQDSIQAKTSFSSSLNDAKTKLDLSISLVWLSVFSTAFWIMVSPLICKDWTLFCVVWFLGPLVSRGWYLVSIQNYRSFADLLRCSVDLCRLDLLTAYRLNQPENSESEQEIWIKLNKKMCYGEDVLLPYKS